MTPLPFSFFSFCRLFYQENDLLQRQVDNAGRTLWSGGNEVSTTKEDRKRYVVVVIVAFAFEFAIVFVVTVTIAAV